MLKKYFLKFLKKSLDFLNASKYILSMTKMNLKIAKMHTTISIPKSACKFIEPLRTLYSGMLNIPLTRGETVAKALESEHDRYAK